MREPAAKPRTDHSAGASSCQAARHLARSSPDLRVHRIKVPFTVVPIAPSGLQNAPGCTPERVGAVVGFGFGFFVVGLGFGAVVFGGLVVGRAVVGFGLALVGAAVVGAGGDVVAAVVGTVVVAAAGGVVVAAVVGAVVVGRAASGWATAVVGFFAGVPMMAPKAASPPRHSTTTENSVTTATSHTLVFFFGGGAGGGYQDGFGGTGEDIATACPWCWSSSIARSCRLRPPK